MRIFPRTSTFPALLMCATAALTAPAFSKTRAAGSSASVARVENTLAALHAMEQRLTPLLEAKVAGTPLPGMLPSQPELLTIVRSWNLLSPEFRSLYVKATTIPKGYVYFASPGGHFEVYYTISTTTPDSVSKVDPTDRISYGPADWRLKVNQGNGVPDYIDEVAWALDSAWSMEIERFGFVRPAPSDTNRGDRMRYKMLITRQERDDDYAYTWPGPPIAGAAVGFTSFIEMRNTWDGWTYLDYEHHPENAARVTCAHEFFHSIQYAMSWGVVNYTHLDDFPVAWLEGTAVLMEELAFPNINDYIQYTDIFFDEPDSSILCDRPRNEPYHNSLITKYLYQHASGHPSIDFVRTVFRRNYTATISFDENLTQTSTDMGTEWRRLLGGFHAASFFTGDRADTSIFLDDAALMNQWDYLRDPAGTSKALVKKVLPQGMSTFYTARQRTDGDTLKLVFSGYDASGRARVYDDQWSLNLILMDTVKGSYLLTPIAVSTTGTVDTALTGWSAWNAALLVVSNADFAQIRSAAVGFGSDTLLPRDESPPIAAPNPVRLRSRNDRPLKVRGTGMVSCVIRALSGGMVAHATFDATTSSEGQSWNWNLTNAAQEPVAPGTYILVVTYQSSQSSGTRTKKFKILVVP